MAKQIRFDIKLNVDGKEIVGATASDVKELRKAWDGARTSMQKFQDTMYRFNQISYGLQGILSAMNSLTDESRTCVKR